MNLKITKHHLILLLFCSTLSIFGQNLKDTSTVNELNQSIIDCVYSNFNKAKSIGFKSLALAKKIGYKKGEAIALSRIGIAYDVESNYDSAIFYYTESIKIHKSIGNKKGVGAGLCNIGLTYLNQNDYTNALQNLQAAIKPLSEAQEHEYMGNCFNNIALLFLEFDNYDRAMSYFHQAEKEYDLCKNKKQMAYVISNIAMVYSEQKHYDSSINLELRAIPYYMQDSDYYNLAKSYNNIGLDYRMLKNYETAIANYMISVEYAKKYGSKSGLSDTYTNIATVYSVLGKHKESEAYAKLALDLLPYIKSRKLKSDLFYLYGKIKYRQDDYKAAAKFFNDAIWLKDSVFKIESAELISKAEIRFGLEKKESENRQLIQKNRIQQLEILNTNNEIRYRKYLNIIISSLAIVVILSLVYYLRKRLLLQRLLADNQLKSEQQTQRVQISHELHDNVGAQLSYIVSNLDVLQTQHPEDKRIGSVTDMSKQAIVTLRETVWALNNESISVIDFADKFKQYTSKILDFNPNVACHFKENLNKNAILQPLQALNLFRICQEAFSNAIHHSGASSIQIEFANSEKVLFDLKIMDNGIGFDHEEAALKGHYGLLTMRTRSEELGAKFEINSKKGSGTTVVFTLNNN